MEKPKIEDFEIKSHDCWGTTTYRADYYAYSQALEKYINTSEPHLPLGDFNRQVCKHFGIKKEIADGYEFYCKKCGIRL